MRIRGALEGAPERMFDLLYMLSSTTESQKITWPALAILNAISSDRLAPDLIRYTSENSMNRAKAARPVRRPFFTLHAYVDLLSRT